MLTVSENVRLAGDRKQPAGVGQNGAFDPHRPVRLSQQPAPTVGLRTFGNSYPQSSVGLHTMSLTATVRPGRRILFGSHRVSECVGGCHGMARLFGSRAFICVVERLR